MSMGMGWKFPALVATLWAVALAVWGAAAASLVSGPEGTLIGAALTTLAGVVTAFFIPSLRDEYRRRIEERKRREAEEAAARSALDAMREPVAEMDQGPAALLRPDRRIVRFTGRARELEDLRAWCASGETRSLRVLVGAGGVGKTRLALEVAADWRTGGGESALVADGTESLVVGTARAATSGGVLLVVDYAETRTGLDGMVRAVLRDPGPLRVLLLARSLGEWWDRLVERSPSAVARLLTEAPPIRLATPVTEDASDAELVAAAVPDFARALSVSVPAPVEVELPAQRAPVLVLHASALVAVLRLGAEPTQSSVVVVNEEVIGELLQHEARYWRRTASSAGLPDDGTILKPLVAVAALLGAESMVEVTGLVDRVPELAGISAAEKRAWARWLYGLYPTDSGERLGSLQPDMVAERHVVMQLAPNPDLARKCFRDLSEQQAHHSLTVLSRALTSQEPARAIIATALDADLAGLAVTAARVSIETNSDLAELLTSAIRDAPASLAVFVRIADALVKPSVVLAKAHLAAVERVLASLPPECPPDIVAAWSDRLSSAFSRLGRFADAVRPNREAVTIFEELAKSDPARYWPDLADSLNNLGMAMSHLGIPVDGLAPAQRSIIILRELAETGPDKYRPRLARSLSNLSVLLYEVGRPGESLSLAEEAVDIYRDLAETNPNEYRPDLGYALDNLGVRLAKVEDLERALEVTRESVAILRELSQIDSDRYDPDLAIALANLSNRLYQLGRLTDAVPYALDSVEIRYRLAAALPDRYGADLGESLNNLSTLFGNLGDLDASVRAAQQAVAIYRWVAEANPDYARPRLAAALHNLAVTLSALGRDAEATAAQAEAATLSEES
jgi:tetratricopeptide (TPR) repeat protein